MSDNEYDVHLWLRIERGGEIAAFRELFDRYYAPLCRFAEFWLRDRASAEEVVLDVYTHVWQHAAEAVSQLPGRCRDIFLKSRNEQLSNAEIAAEMHISVKTVEAQMSKALRRLRGLLHKE